MAGPVEIADLDLVLAATEGLWDELRGQRLFITGGTGFFGCWLLESFAHINKVKSLGARATILSRDPHAFAAKCPHLAANPAIQLLAGDVRTFAFPSGGFRYIIHAATDTSAQRAAEDPAGLLSSILDGTRRVLEFASEHGAQKFLLTSSGAVYGAQPPSIGHVSEEYCGAPSSLDPGAVYAEGKRTAELMSSVYGRTHGFECKVARCFAFVGPHLPLDAHFAIGNFLRDILRGGPISINGDGTPLRSYMYAADLAIWLWTMLLRAPAFEAFNVGSEQALSILDLARTVVAACGSSAEIRVAQKPEPGAPLRQYVPSTRKADRLLGLRCRVPIEEAIRRTAAWYRDGTPESLAQN